MSKKKVYKHYVIYKITNLKNNMVYIGMHRTNDLNDNYMGSGKRLRRSIQYHGVENFTKEILFDFNDEQSMIEKEIELVNEEFIKRDDTYNLTLGGHGSWEHIKNKVNVYDNDGNIISISKDHPKYKNGTYKAITKGTVNVKDIQGNSFRVSVDDSRFETGEIVGYSKGEVAVTDKEGKKYRVSITDPRILSGDLIPTTKGTVTVKDGDNNYFNVSLSDSRYLLGELKFAWCGKKHSEETKAKMKASAKKRRPDQNSQFGTMWITNGKENKKIQKCDKIPIGWKKGRKIKK